MEVNFVGNYPIDWKPAGPDTAEPYESSPLSQPNVNDAATDESQKSQSSESSTVPRTKEQIIQRFQQYLRDNIRQLEEGDSQADYLPDARAKLAAVDQKITYLALLAITLDPSANFGDLVETVRLSKRYRSLEDLFYVRANNYGALINKIRAFWGRNASWGIKTEETGSRGSAVDSDALLGDESGAKEVGSPDMTPRKRRKPNKGKSSAPAPAKLDRSAADKTAQHTVPQWYAGRCVLTNGKLAQGAHIIPVRTSHSIDLDGFSLLLGMFWDWDREKVVASGHETANMLPLRPDAHYLWDRYCFGIRPIRDAGNPQRIFLQMEWLQFDKKHGNLNNMNHADFGTIVDFRRGLDGRFPPVVTGDLYQIITPNPDKYPLPCFEFLQMQYAVHKIISGLKAAGSLETIFRGDPPDVDPLPASRKAVIPEEWAFLIDEAVEAGVLDTTMAKRWSDAFIWNTQFDDMHF